MKKFLPFVFPVAALVIIIALGVRWYNLNTSQTKGEIGQTGEGVEIKNLSTLEQEKIAKGGENYKKVALSGDGEVDGEVRYEVKDGQVAFHVAAALAAPVGGEYQVWIKPAGAAAFTKAFSLSEGKGGWQGTASVTEDKLPLELAVTKASDPNQNQSAIVLKGTISK